MALINLRNALMARKRLPYDAEVEYLESSGTQWIDTDTPIAYNYHIELTFATTAMGSQYLFGDSISGSSLFRWAQSSTGTFRIETGNGTAVGTPPTISTNIVYTARVDNKACYLDGTQFGTIGNSDPSTPRTEHAFLFAWNRNPILKGKARIYSCKIYDENGNAIRDFIPVRRGTVGYLYDRVSGKLFYNQGTGDFVVGQDVVPVEYLRHTGTQWIDTGYAMADSRKIYIRVNWSAHSTTSREMMGGGTSGSYFVEVNANGYYAVGATVSTISSIKAEGTDNLTWAYNVGEKPTLSVNGALAATDANIRVPSGIFKTAISASFAPHCDLYALDIYTDNDEQTRRMLPVRVGTEGAMMDVLTRRIYRNAGTGAFTYGNDLKYPIPA